MRLGSLELGPRPRIVLAVRGPAAAVTAAVRKGADVLELRADLIPRPTIASAERAAATLRTLGPPLLLTVRSAREGGGCALADGERRDLFLALLPLVEAVDVEIAAAGALRSVIQAARAQGKLVLLSHHDFARTPGHSALERRLREARRAGADVVKLATQVRNREDTLRLFLFTWKHRRTPLVTMGMGPQGSLSRLLLPLAGSLLVYTSLRPVFGQIPLARLVADLNFYFPPAPAD